MPSPVPDLPAFDLKSSAWTITVLRLHTADVEALAAALRDCAADSPGLFDNEPVVLDLAPLAADDLALDIGALMAALRAQGLRPVALQGGSAAQMAAALEAGLPEACARLPRAEAPARVETAGGNETGAAAEAGEATDRTEGVLPAGDDRLDAAVRPEILSDDAVPTLLPAVAEEPIPAAAPVRRCATLVVDTPLRSGQRVYARGGDLVVLSLVSFGAEVIADGSIHVYGPLRGRAIAGASGDVDARIFSTDMDPQLVSIAGIYRTTEVPFPDGVQGRAAQVRLEGERLVVEPLRF